MLGRRRASVLMGATFSVLAFGVWALLVQGTTVEPFQAFRERFASSDFLVRDRHGEPLQMQRVSFQGRALHWVALAELPPAVVAQLVAAEDARFWLHAGVDWRALLRALYRSVLDGQRQGGSTITMQLSSLIRQDGWRRGVLQKVWQIAGALSLEQNWSKEQILEGYINLVPFRGELQGIAAAARTLFGKYPEGLSVAEGAVLAALVRSPNASSAVVGERACRVLVKNGQEDQCELARSVAGTMRSQGGSLELSSAPFVAKALFAQLPNQREAISTIDASLQQRVAAILGSHLQPLRSQNARDGAVLVVDNEHGDVLAYVGNTGLESTARYVDGVAARRSAGSTLKPFLYAAALDARLLTASSTLDDAPLNIPVEHGVYRPEDYDRQYRGPVSARIALASSLNIPAVQLLGRIGVAKFAATLQQTGLTLGKDPVMYGFSMALGTPAVSLWELVNAYRVLARGGEWAPLRLTLSEHELRPRRVFSAGASYVVSDILSDRQSRAETFGLENPLATRFWSAAKTGTSRDMTDNWCIGYTQRHTVGVWVGNFSGEPMWNVTGISGAAPVWVEVMSLLAERFGSNMAGIPAPPRSEVVQVEGEWYLRGTEPAPLEQPRASASISKITYPVDSMVVALDPEVSEDRQRILLRSSQQSQRVFFLVDGIRQGATSDSVWWKVRRGAHRVELQGLDGRTLDAVSFVVR